MFADLAESTTETIRRLYGENFVIDETRWRGKAVGKPFGLNGRGRPLEFRMLHVLEFTDDGAIKRENVWLDFAAIAKQLS
jgi:predicted ester cyclase